MAVVFIENTQGAAQAVYIDDREFDGRMGLYRLIKGMMEQIFNDLANSLLIDQQ